MQSAKEVRGLARRNPVTDQKQRGRPNARLGLTQIGPSQEVIRPAVPAGGTGNARSDVRKKKACIKEVEPRLCPEPAFALQKGKRAINQREAKVQTRGGFTQNKEGPT